MPPKTRRAASGPTARAGQSMLSFKGRVSKPTDSTTALKNAKTQLNEPAKEIITSEIVKQSTPEPEVQPKQTGKGKAPQVESPVRILPPPSRKKKVRRSAGEQNEAAAYEAAEKQANDLSDARITKFWKAEENKRLAPQIHQQGVHMHEKILRHFDLSSEYGPCIGITRLRRWKRARALSLNPPIEVLAVILREEAKENRKGGTRDAGRIAYIDELSGARDLAVAA
ncbi:hypothetical protein LTR05_006105 [Lithohypha guttulata]|uniref:DNA polymerase delta subunit 4 n=1 Tax=Lithohypha guttulata TaxID=1690604 RepID=A0AAN7SWR0_9EURO|nr:hypothetical protein LTR05_006105 [Lithohypha guttulata]